MLIAKKLKQDNIAEYLLYMWQVEDLIRANGFDMQVLEERIISKFVEAEVAQQEICDWYENLIAMMQLEGLVEKGHLIINQNILAELTDLHIRLLKSPTATDYSTLYYKTLPYIVELRSKSSKKDIPELETCFAALYGYLLLRLEQKEISGETQAAIAQIGSLLRLLSQRYKQEQEEVLEL